jgi:Transposase DDE domain group 1
MQLCFDGFLKMDSRGSPVISDRGLVLVLELDERLGLNQLIAHHLTAPRGTNCRLPLADLLRQSAYSRLAGCEDVNDAKRLSQDPPFWLIGLEKTWDRGAVQTSRLQSFEIEPLAFHVTGKSFRQCAAKLRGDLAYTTPSSEAKMEIPAKFE